MREVDEIRYEKERTSWLYPLVKHTTSFDVMEAMTMLR